MKTHDTVATAVALGIAILASPGAAQTALNVVATSPVAHAIQVPVKPVIEIYFDQALDHASVERALTINPSVPGVRFVGWGPGRFPPNPPQFNPTPPGGKLVTQPGPAAAIRGESLLLTYRSPLAYNTAYTITIGTDAHGANGAALVSPYALAFTTARDIDDIAPPPPDQARRALVLSGGASKGDFQVGAIKYLYNEQHFYPDIIIGVSVGALNAGLLAQARRGDPTDNNRAVSQLESIWRSLRGNSDIYVPTAQFAAVQGLSQGSGNLGIVSAAMPYSIAADLLLPPIIGSYLVLGGVESGVRDRVRAVNQMIRDLVNSDGLYTEAPLNLLVKQNLNIPRLQTSSIDLRVGAVNLVTGRYEEFDKYNPDIVDCIMASTAMPDIFLPVTINGAPYVDGGVRTIAPLRSALDRAVSLGANDIIVVLASPANGIQEPARAQYARMHGVQNILLRAVEHATYDEVLADDMGWSMDVNRLVNRYEGNGVRIRVIEPVVELHNSMNFDPEGLRRGMEHGEAMARHVMAGAACTPLPQPIEKTRSSSYLVVRPLDTHGQLILDAAHQSLLPTSGLVTRTVTAPTSQTTVPATSSYSIPTVRIPVVEITVDDDVRRPAGLWRYPDYSDIALPFDDSRIYSFPIHYPRGSDAYTIHVRVSYPAGVGSARGTQWFADYNLFSAGKGMRDGVNSVNVPVPGFEYIKQ